MRCQQYPATYNSAHGAIQPSGTTDTMTYGYDDDQNPLLTVDGRGVVTGLVRSDPESLPTQKSYGGLPIQNSGVTLDLTTAPSIAGTGSTITLGSLPSGVSSIAAVDLSYDIWGRMASMIDGTGTLTYGDPANTATAGYDDRDRVLLTTKSFAGGPQGQQLAYSYFQDGSLNAMTLPGAGQVSNPLTSYNAGQFSYVYDPGGRLMNLYVPWPVSSEGVGSKNKFTYFYQNNNWLYYVTGDLGYCRYGFDGRGFVTNLSNNSSSTKNNFSSNISTYGTFTYDAAGNRTGEQMQSQATDLAFAWDHALTWTYDNRDRLTHEHCVGLSSASIPNQPTINYDQYFGYDGADNLTNFKDPMAGQMADFGFNVDNQAASPMGFGFDGAGSMLAEPTGGLFAGDTLSYDPEERLASVSSGATTLLANAYDGAGMRAVKTTAADGTVYFLDDAAGAPVVEETYTASPTPTTTLSKVNAFGPDGLRSRYTATGGGSETAYFFDPQGAVVSRVVSSDPAVQFNGEPFTDVSVWDGYGQQRNDNWSGQRADAQYSPDDPAGFGAQAGYYADWEVAQTSMPASYVYLRSVPSLLTHRYYDASTGRFVNRDPIGYGGGPNLYGYCGGNPVNLQDPSGNSAGDWIDKYLLNGSISHWGNVQGRYDAGKASKGELALAAINGSGQTILLAVSIADGVGGVKALPALIKSAAKDIPSLASRTGVIAYRKLEQGTLGQTDWVGNITLDISLKGKEATQIGTQTLAHENVHVARVGNSLMSAIAHHIGYNGSNLYKFYEEFSAEYTATSEFWHSFHGAGTYVDPVMFAREANVAAHLIKPVVTGIADHR